MMRHRTVPPRALWLAAAALAIARLAPARLDAQGLVRLDSATVTALSPLSERIARAGEMRMRTPRASVVLLGPGLVSAGLTYRELSGSMPRLDGGAFALDVRGSGALPGVIAGALVGGALGAYAGHALSRLPCNDPCLTSVSGPIIVGILGALPVAMLGGWLASHHRPWRRLYQSPTFLP